MEQTTLQQRIEERAKEKLLKDLLDAYMKEQSIKSFINNSDLFKAQLDVRHYYGRSHSRDTIEINGEFTEKIFNALLPKYIRQVTDEILQKIDEIDYLVNSTQEQEV